MLKQLDQHLVAPIEKQILKEVRKESKHIVSMQPHPGQHIFKYDTATKEISVIGNDDYEMAVATMGSGKVNKKLVMQKGCIYVVAVNKRNAAKKFLRLLIQQSINAKNKV